MKHPHVGLALVGGVDGIGAGNVPRTLTTEYRMLRPPRVQTHKADSMTDHTLRSWFDMTKTNGTKSLKALAYHKYFFGPMADGFKIPCVPVDSRNVIRTYLMAITPDTLGFDEVFKVIHGGDFTQLRAKDIVLKVRIQRWFKGTEPNPNDSDGLIPSVGQHGEVMDVPVHLFATFANMVKAANADDIMAKAATLTKQAKDASEANARKCPACSHKVTPSAKFCPECGTVLPAEPVKETAKVDSWTCSQGHKAQGKFCTDCGEKAPKVEGPIKATETAQEAPKPLEAPTTLADLASAVQRAHKVDTAPAFADISALLANPSDLASLAGKLMAMARKATAAKGK